MPELDPDWPDPEGDPAWPMLELEPDWPELELPELPPDCATIDSVNSSATANTNSEYFRIFSLSLSGEIGNGWWDAAAHSGFASYVVAPQTRVPPGFLLVFMCCLWATSRRTSAYNEQEVFPTAATPGNTRSLWRRLGTNAKVQETQGAGGNVRASRVWKGNQKFDDLIIE